MEPWIDLTLADEIRRPGADNRFGVTFVARPPELVLNTIAGFIEKAAAALAAVPRINLARARVAWDERAAVLQFTETTNLMIARERLAADLTRHGVTPSPRYRPLSAHLTWLRYRQPLAADRIAWEAMLAGLFADADLAWSVHEAWMTTGAVWYGRASRVLAEGPFRLGAQHSAKQAGHRR
jgi:hypothetical protein